MKNSIAALVLWIGALTGMAVFDPAACRFMSRLQPATNDAAIAMINLNNALYGAAQTDLRDLRLAVNGSNEVPYLVKRGVIMKEWQGRLPQASDVVSLDTPTNGSLDVIVVLTGSEPRANGITIETPLKDFERTVTVYSGNDRTRWQPLVENAVIFDYSRYLDFSNHDIPFPESVRCRFLKLEIRPVTDEQQSSLKRITRETRGGSIISEQESTIVKDRPFRIDRIRAWRTTTVRAARMERKTDYPVAGWTVSNDIENQVTVLNITTEHAPLTGFILDAADVNFSRAVELQVPVSRKDVPGKEYWRTITDTTVSDIRIGSFVQQNLKISFPEQRRERYRIFIHNHDNPVLAVQDVRAEGSLYRLYFLPQPGREYTVYSGNQDAPAPRYDTAALEQGLQQGVETAVWTTDPVVTNPVYVPAVPKTHTLNWMENKVMLWITIGVMIIGLGIAIWHSGRRIETGN